jgi:hypothetical protein
MSVAYPVRGLHGPIPLSAGLFGSLRASQTLLSYRGFISRRGAPEPVRRVDLYRKNPSSACFVAFSGKTDGIGHCYFESCARPRPAHPSDSGFSLRAHSLLRSLALLSLGHPLGAFPAPCGTSRLCFFGSFQKKSPAPNTTLGAASARAGRDFFRLLPKKRRSPLGAGHLASQAKGCPE